MVVEKGKNAVVIHFAMYVAEEEDSMGGPLDAPTETVGLDSA